MDAPIAVVTGISLKAVLAHQIFLSIGVERIIEILKGFLPIWPLVPSDTKAASASSERLRCAAITLLAAAIGTAFCWGIHLNILHVAHVRSGYIAAGLVASAGAAFWNHILDILKAVKVEKESAAAAALGKVLG